MGKTNIEDWVANYRRRKWRFAERAVKQRDHCKAKWTEVLLQWSPVILLDGFRRPGRPSLRFDDEIRQYIEYVYGDLGENWMSVASDEDTWKLLENDFVAQRWNTHGDF